MEDKPLFETATEMDLVIKLSNIFDDAILIKTGKTSIEHILKEGNEKGREVVAANIIPPSLLRQIADRGLTRGLALGKWGLYGIGALSAYYILRRAINALKDRGKAKKESNLPEILKGLDRKGTYKFREQNQPSKYKQVSPGFYDPVATQENWYQQAEGQKFWDARQKHGVPAGFGIDPGFYLHKPVEPSAFQNLTEQIRTSESDDERVVTAQGFKDETIDPIKGQEGLNPNIAGWVNLNNWEQFLSQGALDTGKPWGAQWAAAPTPESAFFDPSGAMGRTKAMEWKPVGYGQEFYKGTPDEADLAQFRKERLEAFTGPETYRQAVKAIYLTRLLDLREQEGLMTPDQAAQAREMISVVVQGHYPEKTDEVLNLIEQGLGEGIHEWAGTEGVDRLDQEQADWESIVNPLEESEKYQGRLEKAQELMRDYEEGPRHRRLTDSSLVLV